MKTLTRGYLRRALSMLLTVIMVLSLCTVALTSASAAEVNLADTAATITGGTTLYMKPNSNWKSDNARFAAYLCNGSSASTWLDMALVEGETDIYYVTVPAGQSHANIIFCRMNPAKTENNWNNDVRWNQTGDLTWDGSKSLFTITDWGNGSWSSYTPPVVGPAKPAAPTDAQVVFNDTLGGTGTEADPYLVSADSATVSMTISAEYGVADGLSFNVGYTQNSVPFTPGYKSHTCTNQTAPSLNETKLYTVYIWAYNLPDGANYITNGLLSSEAVLSDPVTVEVYAMAVESTTPLELNVSAADVIVGNNITIDVTTNYPDATINYTLTDVNASKEYTNTTGDFTVPTLKGDAGTEKRFTLYASTVVDGETLTETSEFTVNVAAITLNFSAPQSVETGMSVRLTATTNTAAAVTFEFYNADGPTLLQSDTAGIYSEEVGDSDIGTTRTYYVVLKTMIAGEEYTITSEPKTVRITDVLEAYEVNIYFKSADSMAYKPYITTTHAVEDLSSASMERTTLIGYNASMTASYSWYKATVQVSKASAVLSVNIVGSRYALEGNIDLTITESGDIYLGMDNLNYTPGNKIVDLTDAPVSERNWVMSAVNMVYDERIDGETLESVSARAVLRTVGDADGDGRVTIKDATAIQKYLADIASFGVTDENVSDVNGDGKITIKDATAIQTKLVALL